jgi:hypothetical protein
MDRLTIALATMILKWPLNMRANIEVAIVSLDCLSSRSWPIRSSVRVRDKEPLRDKCPNQEYLPNGPRTATTQPVQLVYAHFCGPRLSIQRNRRSVGQSENVIQEKHWSPKSFENAS